MSNSVFHMRAAAAKESLPALWPFADAFIVGSSFEEAGAAGGSVETERVQQLLGVHAELLQSLPR